MLLTSSSVRFLSLLMLLVIQAGIAYVAFGHGGSLEAAEKLLIASAAHTGLSLVIFAVLNELGLRKCRAR
ncbi:MAG TPA: hypothetical protein V6D17_06845 [Candidatus Obscuribacterales bacterium]